MTTLELTLQLPDELVQRAQSAGLLTSEAIERLVRDAIRKEAARQLIEIGKELRTAPPAISEEELEAELKAVRADLREARARGN
jgi:post-segregation antitoxin (ccd killing protein)